MLLLNDEIKGTTLNLCVVELQSEHVKYVITLPLLYKMMAWCEKLCCEKDMKNT